MQRYVIRVYELKLNTWHDVHMFTLHGHRHARGAYNFAADYWAPKNYSVEVWYYGENNDYDAGTLVIDENTPREAVLEWLNEYPEESD